MTQPNESELEKWLLKARDVVSAVQRRKTISLDLCEDNHNEPSQESLTQYARTRALIPKLLGELEAIETKNDSAFGLSALFGSFPPTSIAVTTLFLAAKSITSAMDMNMQTVADVISLVCDTRDPMSMVRVRDAFAEDGILYDHTEVSFGILSLTGIHELCEPHLSEESTQRLLGRNRFDSRVAAAKQMAKQTALARR